MITTKVALGVLLGPIVACQAHAEIYLTDEKAVQVIFPDQAFERKTIDLTDDEIKAITDGSGERVRAKKPIYFKSKSGNVVFIDQVLGKHEFITYATGINSKGEVAGVEIMEYRESFGSQVKGPEWRTQFLGKTVSAPLKLDEDIKNISGATLSSSHVAGGVKRLLKTYEVIKARF